MSKLYLTQNVYEATQERLRFIFAEFDNIYIAFSGGKDSGVLWNLMLKYMKEHGMNRKIGLFHQDFEAEYQATSEYVERVFTTAPDFVERFWCCFPHDEANNLSFEDASLWYPWDDEKKNLWVRPMPDYPYVYSLKNNPFDFFEYHMQEETFYKKFLSWYRLHCNAGKTIALLGLCADESLNRYKAVSSKVRMYKKEYWTTYVSKDCYYGYPIYDWTVEDIWIANGKFNFDYNRVYDIMYKTGISLSEMRVATPFLSEGHDMLKFYKEIEPKTWERLIKRVSGVNFGGIYGDTEGMAHRNIKLPRGHTWKSYADFLVSTLPEQIKPRYKKVYSLCEEEENYKSLCRGILRCDDARFGNFGATKRIHHQQKVKTKRKYANILNGGEDDV